MCELDLEELEGSCVVGLEGRDLEESWQSNLGGAVLHQDGSWLGGTAAMRKMQQKE